MGKKLFSVQIVMRVSFELLNAENTSAACTSGTVRSLALGQTVARRSSSVKMQKSTGMPYICAKSRISAKYPAVMRGSGSLNILRSMYDAYMSVASHFVAFPVSGTSLLSIISGST